MTEHPILFSPLMVQAILTGRKTETRRIVKPQPPEWAKFPQDNVTGWQWTESDADDDMMQAWPENDGLLPCPYGVSLHRLWVQESYSLTALGGVTEAARLKQGCDVTCRYSDGTERIVILTADDVEKLEARKSDRHKKQPGRFMYRSCSRITLEVTEIRAERLQDMTDGDAIAEGAECPGFPPSLTNRGAFAKLWESLHGPLSWRANPWVWVISFRRVEP